MTDDYHFDRDPADLIDAKLTKDEAEAVESYRLAKEKWGDRKMDPRNIVVVVPVAADANTEDFEPVLRDIAGGAAVDAARRDSGS
jgi:hypothetical protein